MSQSFKEFLTEAKKTVIEDPHVEKQRHFIDRIMTLIFGQKGDYVRDAKRSQDYKYYGVVNTKSLIKTAKDHHLRLTVDNSTTSGEFEINSLTQLKIVKDGSLDKKLRALYKTFEIKSKKRTSYIIKNGETVLREIHLGKSIDVNTVKFVKALLKLLKPE